MRTKRIALLLAVAAAVAFVAWAGTFLLSRVHAQPDSHLMPYPVGARVVTADGSVGTITAAFDRRPNWPQYQVKLDGDSRNWHYIHTKIKPTS